MFNSSSKGTSGLRKAFLAFAAFFCTGAASGFEKSSCGACHAPTHRNDNCVSCHTAGSVGSPREELGLYTDAPRFETSALNAAKPFSSAGLASYLIRPIDRRGSKGTMFQLRPRDAAQAAELFVDSLGPDTYNPEKEKVEAGRKSFEELGCVACHSDKTKAPLLPIGVQLFNFDFFARAVRSGRSYASDQSTKKKLMPSFATVSDLTLQELYSYVSLERPKSSREQDAYSSVSLSKEILFQAAMKVFASNGCVHCHGSKTASFQVNRIFGGRSENFSLGLGRVTEQLQVNILLPELHAVGRKTWQERLKPVASLALSSQQDARSRLLASVKERAREVSVKDNELVRGMPLSLPALKPGEIRILERWVEQKCPTPDGDFCE